MINPNCLKRTAYLLPILVAAAMVCVVGASGYHLFTEHKRHDAGLQRLGDEIQLQRLRVFKATMRTVQDIVNNLPNGLPLVHFDAEGQQRVEMRALVDRAIQEAAVKLKTLGDLETVTERELGIGLGIDYPGADS